MPDWLPGKRNKAVVAWRQLHSIAKLENRAVMPHPSRGNLILAVADGSNELIVTAVITHPVLHDAISEALRALASVRVKSPTLIEADAPHWEIRAGGVILILSVRVWMQKCTHTKRQVKSIIKQSIL